MKKMNKLSNGKASRYSLKSLILLCVTAGIVYADGLPGEYLVSSRWRDLLWWHSPLSNPAFLTYENYITLRGAFAPTMQGAFKLWETGATMPIGMTQSAGLSVLGENDGTVYTSTLDDVNNRLVMSDQGITNDNLFVMTSYAINPWKKLSIGANVNTAYQSNFGNHLIGLGLDLGASYRILSHPKAGDHTIGISTVNLVTPAMGRTLFSTTDYSGAYSRNLRLSWAADFRQRQFESGLDFDIKDFWANAKEFRQTGSLSETAKELEWGIGWRIGAWIFNTFGTYLQMGFDRNFFEYWGLAGGVRVPWAGRGPEVSMLYQYNIKSEGSWASEHTFYVIMNLGKSREDMWGKRMKQVASLYDPGEKTSAKDLKKIQGIKIEEEKEFVKITAEEVAIHFASGSSDIPPEAIKVLKQMANFLRNYPNHSVSIEGHTENDPITGRLKEIYADNYVLSKARCEKVKEYFVNMEKLPSKTFTTTGFGPSKPIAPNTTPQSKYKNRRVVVVIKK